MIQPAKSVDKAVAHDENKGVKDRTEQLQQAAQELRPLTDEQITANGRALGLTDNCVRVLKARYLKKDAQGKLVETPEQLFRRVARVVAATEHMYKGAPPEAEVQKLEDRFFELMVTGQFMPNSPTLMNAGREMGMLSACFVLPVGDSIDEIFDTVKATALIQKAGGGTGFAFDRLRPTGDYIKSSGGTTSGPISFWKVLSEATNAIQQGAFRRGANMGMMNITHPDVLKFIEAKQDLTQFTNYNISVKVPDAWMNAYKADREGPHVVINPRSKAKFVLPKNLELMAYQMSDLLPLEEYRGMAADDRPDVWRMGELYDMVVDHAWQTGEPGIVFIDRINQANPTPHIGTFEATNPCGEQPLLPYEACNLGSINLGLFVKEGPEGEPKVDWDTLRDVVRDSTRFLDNIIDANNYPIPQITEMCTNNRKIGLGIMGFADALYKLGVAYNSKEGVAWGERFMKFLNDESHKMSEELAEIRGCFPNWEGSTWQTLHGRKMRNACTTTVAPTGTISIIAGCSGGVEPLFSLAFFRHVMRDHKGEAQQMVEVNPVFEQTAKARGIYTKELMDKLASAGTLHDLDVPEDIKHTFVCAHDITPEWHIKMQAAYQRHCDSSISKTTNFPHDAKPEDVRAIYDLAFDLGCKGVTVYRDGCRDHQPMALKDSHKKKDAKVEKSAVTETASSAGTQVPVLGKPVRTPQILSAVRIRQNTPFGHMHVTITVDPRSSRELEVFAQLGKAGDVAMSDLEAICRMVSLFLRAGGSLELVMDQLEGIGSHLSIPTRDGRVMSLGDALGKTIRKYWQAKKQFGLKAILLGEVDLETFKAGANGQPAGGTGIPDEAEPIVTIEEKAQTAGDRLLEKYKLKCPECGSGTLTFMEGCVKCPGCGFSQC